MSTPQATLRTMSPRARRQWTLAGIALVLIGTVLAVWFGLSATSGVQVFNSGNRVISDEEIELRFDLRREPDKDAVCELTAYDEHHATVGRAEITVPADGQEESRNVATVRTTSRALTGLVERCHYAD